MNTFWLQFSNMFQHLLCTMPQWIFKHLNTFLSLKVFVFNHIVYRKASCQSDYSTLKAVHHHNYNSHKQFMYFFILKHFGAMKTLKLLNKHHKMFKGNTYFFRLIGLPWIPRISGLMFSSSFKFLTGFSVTGSSGIMRIFCLIS